MLFLAGDRFRLGPTADPAGNFLPAAAGDFSVVASLEAANPPEFYENRFAVKFTYSWRP